MTQAQNSRHSNIVLLCILFAAAVVRFWGIGFGLPHTQCRPDESTISGIIFSPLNDFHPGDFRYPSFFRYLVLGCYGLYFWGSQWLGHSKTWADLLTEFIGRPDMFFLISRALSASLGVATVFICYKISLLFFERRTALLSAFFTAFAYLHVRDSHFGTVDVPLTFFIMCAVFFIVKAYQKGSPRAGDWIFAGICAGLATSIKYTGVLLWVPFWAARGLASYGAGFRRERLLKEIFLSRRALSFGIFFGAAFLLGTPYALLDFPHFIADLRWESEHLAQGHLGLMLGQGWWYHFRFSLWLGLGFNLLLASLAGIFILGKKRVVPLAEKPTPPAGPGIKPGNEGAGKALILCSFPLGYYFFIGQGYTVFLRYMIPVVPFLCITAAVFTNHLLDKMEKIIKGKLPPALAAALIFLIIGPSFYNIVAFDFLLTRKDNRLLVTDWITENIPDGSSVAQFASYWGKVQLPPTEKALQDEYARFENTSSLQSVILPLKMAYRQAHPVKGFGECGFDEFTGKFNCRNPTQNRPAYILVEESPLFLYSFLSDEKMGILQNQYTLVKSFIAIHSANPQNWFDQGDAFYVPFAGFRDVWRPGPNFFLFKRK